MSTRPDNQTGPSTYRVQIGHLELTVQACSREEAVRLARSRLCSEMPRMWDVIQAADTTRFDVIQVNGVTYLE